MCISFLSTFQCMNRFLLSKKALVGKISQTQQTFQIFTACYVDWKFVYIVTYRRVARQRPRNKQQYIIRVDHTPSYVQHYVPQNL
jgi:hypothetical protein